MNRLTGLRQRLHQLANSAVRLRTSLPSFRSAAAIALRS